MSDGIPERFRVDFSPWRRDLAAKALTRLLSQFWDSPVMKAFLDALVRLGPQDLYDRILDAQERQSLFLARGEDLDAIGRIVGQPRLPYRYDESRWIFADRAGQGADQQYAWVAGASLSGREPVEDPLYRRLILARIACNFCRFSSLPEMAHLAGLVAGRRASWRRTGPMEAELLIDGGVSRAGLEILTRRESHAGADDVYLFPYPATLNLKRIVFVPKKPFIADREAGRQADAGLAAVGRNL